jgi:uncharacterized membrane protein YeaQ/YmgE (transglycosylase-associated protein family)
VTRPTKCLGGHNNLDLWTGKTEKSARREFFYYDETPKATTFGEIVMMHWIWTIIIGFVAGLIAKLITPGTGPMGFWLTAILGIAGAIAATFIGQAVGWYQEGEPAGFIASMVGAVVLLVLYHLFARNKQ